MIGYKFYKWLHIAFAIFIFFIFVFALMTWYSWVWQKWWSQHWHLMTTLVISIHNQHFYRKSHFSGWHHWYGKVIKIHSSSMIWVYFMNVMLVEHNMIDSNSFIRFVYIFFIIFNKLFCHEKPKKKRSNPDLIMLKTIISAFQHT